MRRAFSLVELLVSIAILALLAGLLLPAVLAGREAGRSNHCRMQLRDAATEMAREAGITDKVMVMFACGKDDTNEYVCPTFRAFVNAKYSGYAQREYYGTRTELCLELNAGSERIVLARDEFPLHFHTHNALFLDGHVATVATGHLNFKITD